MKRIIKHRLLNRATGLCMILLIVWGFIFYNALGGGIAQLIGVDWIGCIICAALGVLALAIHKRWFYPEFEGCLSGGNFKDALRFGIPFYIYMLMCIIMIPIFGKFGAPTIDTVCMALMAGFGEEMAFRGLPLSYAMRQWRSKGAKFIILSVIISGVCFGGIHLANLSAGASVTMTMLQVLGATGMGLLLAALFIRSGNLWMCIIIHTVNDVIAFCDVSMVGDGGIMSGQTLTVGNYIDIFVCIIMGIIGLWLVRPAKAEEIRDVWNGKWVVIEQ